MFDKELQITKALHELHGEKSRLSTLVIVYFAGILSAGLFVSQIVSLKLELWKVVLCSLLFLDITSGVVANLSTSTNQYYQVKSKLRAGFILLHIVHPALFSFVFPENMQYFIFMYVFTFISAFWVGAQKDVENQQNIAALLVVTGITLSTFFELPVTSLYAVAPLFMIKLIMGFSVRRPPFMKFQS